MICLEPTSNCEKTAKSSTVCGFNSQFNSQPRQRLTFCRFVNITTPEAEIKDSAAEAARGAGVGNYIVSYGKRTPKIIEIILTPLTIRFQKGRNTWKKSRLAVCHPPSGKCTDLTSVSRVQQLVDDAERLETGAPLLRWSEAPRSGWGWPRKTK